MGAAWAGCSVADTEVQTHGVTLTIHLRLMHRDNRCQDRKVSVTRHLRLSCSTTLPLITFFLRPYIALPVARRYLFSS